MKKNIIKISILIVLLALLLVGCNQSNDDSKIDDNNIIEIGEDEDKSNDTQDNSAKDNETTDKKDTVDVNIKTAKVYEEKYLVASKQDISGIIHVNDDLIYCTEDGKIYSYQKDEDVKKLVFEDKKAYYIQLYKDRIYAINYDENTFYSIKTDGTDYIEESFGMEFSNDFYLFYFKIYKDSMLLMANDTRVITDCVIPPIDIYKYSFTDNSLTQICDDTYLYITRNLYDNCFYYHKYGETTDMPDVAVKYNLDTDEQEEIPMNQNNHNEKSIMSALSIKDNYIYYCGKTYIDRDCMDKQSGTETLFEDNSFLITEMITTEDYIFFINKHDNSDEDNSIISVYRINYDGSGLKEIFNDTVFLTNIATQSITYINDNLLLYIDSRAKIKAIMDFEGNIIEKFTLE